MTTQTLPADSHVVGFIGGGNMASALIGGLIRQGTAPGDILVIEPSDAAQKALRSAFSVRVDSSPSPELSSCGMLVWAIKPQIFSDVASQVANFGGDALHLSVAAGITSSSIARWLKTDRVVRAMPNTPALVGKGITGLFARSRVSKDDREMVASVLAPTGEVIWLDDESQLDAVTALSGSGPAYVFYFLEAMEKAGVQMGLTAEQSRQLGIATFSGAAALAAGSTESISVLRERVTSKGGTTYAALTSMQNSHVAKSFIEAMKAAQSRAAELGKEFGSGD